MACVAEHTDMLLSQRPLLESLLEHILSEGVSKSEATCETYCLTLDDYLELSTLLDPILPSHTLQLCGTVMSRLTILMGESTLTTERFQQLLLSIEIPCRALYALSKVRGVKPFCTHLPHQVHHLRFLLPAIQYVHDKLDVSRSWQVRYVLFIWASVAVRVPFPLDTIVTHDTVDAAVIAARVSLTEMSRVSDASATFLARLLARRDSQRYRSLALQACITDAVSSEASSDEIASSLALLAATFKLAHRDDLILFIDSVFPVLHIKPSTSIEAHRLSKLAHRVALVFLPPRTAAWRYSRATTRLLPSDTSTSNDVAGHEGVVDDNPTDSAFTLSDSDANMLEAIIDLLFESLRHRDTIVRYSAAKGVARLAARLPRSFAHDVADGVLDLLADPDVSRADAAAHGGCLAIAELARRGLLLPSDNQFARALDAVSDAARFDVRRTAASVGAHVRDGACYAVWAIARAYNQGDVAPYVRVISDAIVPVALLDREVNCRRAASAALQECVGRLATDVFPDGIKLITTADYFSLGDRNSAYLSIVPKVAALGNGFYLPAIVDELFNSKLVHWDSSVRVLAAKSLTLLVDLDSASFITRELVPKLVSMSTQRGDAVFRHGAVVGLSELIYKLGSIDDGSFAKDVRNIPMLLRDKGYFVGRTGDEMRIASCQLIKSLAEGMPDVYMVDKDARADAENSLKLLDRVVSCGKEKLYLEATAAYDALFRYVIKNDDGWHIKATRRILKGVLESPMTEFQRGYALALGSCGMSKISNDVLCTLREILKTNSDVEVRRNAAMSLAKVPPAILRDNAVSVLSSLTEGMKDYATDDRGDVGSWVREACMTSFCKVVAHLVSDEQSIVCNENVCNTIMSGLCEIVHECCGRIDRTRTVAGNAMKSICSIFSERPSIKMLMTVCKQLDQIFHFNHIESPENETNGESEIDFSSGETTFPALRQVLHVPALRGAVMRGFVDAGGGTRSQFKAPCQALVNYFSNLNNKNARSSEFESYILGTVQLKEERSTIPALNVIGALARQGALCSVETNTLVRTVREIRASWRGQMRNIKLVLAGLAALDELMCLSMGDDEQFVFVPGTVGREALEALMVVLGGNIPRLRGAAAESVYTALTMCNVDGYEKGCDGRIISAMNVLLDTRWKGMSVLEARLHRDKVCCLLEINPPVPVGKLP